MKRGFFVGLWLTVTRILRCNPFCAGGYDPVPEKKHKRIPKYQRDKAKEENTTTKTLQDREEN
jgi:putative component of membrane protein insertase Oxa1/YidC/SpoIIIJ protein YidD